MLKSEFSEKGLKKRT